MNAASQLAPQPVPCKTIRIAHRFLLNCLASLVVLPFNSCQTGVQLLLNSRGGVVDDGAKSALHHVSCVCGRSKTRFSIVIIFYCREYICIITTFLEFGRNGGRRPPQPGKQKSAISPLKISDDPKKIVISCLYCLSFKFL